MKKLFKELHLRKLKKKKVLMKTLGLGVRVKTGEYGEDGETLSKPQVLLQGRNGGETENLGRCPWT